MWLKCEVIRRALAVHRFVVFTDGDIVYERAGAVHHCVEAMLVDGELELLMQNDGLSDQGDVHGLCAGFMCVRSTPKMRSVFQVDEARLDRRWDDQTYLNTLLWKIRHRALPLRLFPNGQFFSFHHEQLLAKPRLALTPTVLLIHFNWLIGASKRETMERYGRWYVE